MGSPRWRRWIPIVLHMINRQKAKELPFSTLRFLKISVQRTRRRKRIHDVLLMAIRAAVLVWSAVHGFAMLAEANALVTLDPWMLPTVRDLAAIGAHAER